MPSPIVYFQLGATDVEAAAVFFREVFEWDIEAPTGGVTAIDTGAGQVLPNDIFVTGSLRQLSPDAEPFTSLYVRVADLDATIERAAARGARVIVPRTDRPGQATVAVIRAPTGHTFGLVQL
jgi:hypothetical protein